MAFGKDRSDAPTATVFNCATRLLSRRDHSRAELEHKLKQRGYGQSQIEAALARLTELSWIKPDTQLARELTAQLLRAGKSPKSIRHRLARRQFSQSGLEHHLNDLNLNDSGDLLTGAALKAARKIARRLNRSKAKHLQTASDRERFLQQALLTEGFSLEQSRMAIAALKAETDVQSLSEPLDSEI